MAQTTSGVRSVLSLPQVYGLLQRLIGSDAERRDLVERHLRPWPGMRILDVGCGTGSLLALLPEVTYHGFDPSSAYIEAARERFGDRGTFQVAGIEDAAVDEEPFDLVVAKGVLHHLDDGPATAVFELADRCLADDGRVVTIDPTLVDGQASVARFLVSRDRGQSVRAPEGYAALARGHFATVDVEVRHDRLRVPYTHAIVSATR